MRGENKGGVSGRLSYEDGVRDGRETGDREERALLVRFRDRGDLAAFDELVRRTEGRVRAVGLAILRNPVDAEDVAQETFVRAWRHAAAYRGAGSVRSWLAGIAARCAHDALRAARRRRRIAEATGSARGPGSEGDAVGGSRFQRLFELESVLASLPGVEREALVLKEAAGMTYDEIAEATGAPRGTIQSRIHRARRRLLAALEPLKPPKPDQRA